MMSRLLVTTVPFALSETRPLELLQRYSRDFLINPTGRRLTEDDLVGLVHDVEVLIAGTEPITSRVMDAAPNLHLISRVGVGLDNVDLHAARERGIAVSYTPEAPSPAVAELTLGLIFSLLRHTQVANLRMHRGEWYRHTGQRLSAVTVGLIGVGRIGSRVANMLLSLGVQRLLVNDTAPRGITSEGNNLHWVDKETMYNEADVISLHVPLTQQTNNMIAEQQLRQMKPLATLINTSRGGVVNEDHLLTALQSGHLSGAAVDVFGEEPYHGPLSGVDTCLLTSHMGSMSADCRAQMELEATEEAVRFIQGDELRGTVPEAEYELR